jgi:cytochrome P450
MLATTDLLTIDPARLRELFDLRSDVYASRGGHFDGDPNPAWNARRAAAPVHEGIPGPMAGFHGEAYFQGLPFPDRRHFTAFDYATCDEVFHDELNFSASSHTPGTPRSLHETSMLTMDGDQHRRYRALVQPSFVPKQAKWWIDRWIRATVTALVDRMEKNRRADLNLELCAPIPLLTICGSFGVSVAEALDIRAAVTSEGRGVDTFMRLIAPIVAKRRAQPEDDLISVLAHAELTDEAGVRQVLSDAEILGFAFLLLAAGSGTTWKQMGITLHTLLERPAWLARVREDAGALRDAIEEVVRWMPTDPVFARFAARDVTLRGVEIPAGSVIHLCLASANRDPSRWERPDEYDPARPLRSHLGFGSGPHVCLGMHVARAEIFTAVQAVLARLPNLRRDPAAEPGRITGMYERGVTAVPVIWDGSAPATRATPRIGRSAACG